MKVMVFFFSVEGDIYIDPSLQERIKWSEIISRGFGNRFPNNNGWRQVRLAEDRQLWIHHQETIPDNAEWAYLKESLGIDPGLVQEFYVAFHSAMRSDVYYVRNKIQEQFSSAKVFTSLFSKDPAIDIWKSFSQLIQKVTSEQYATIDFDQLTEEIKKKSLTRRISILKHRMAHLFLPIDTDLQGLMESDFNQDYWDDVVEAYQGRKAVATLAHAKRLLYGDGGDDETVKKIVEEAPESAQDRLAGTWQDVKIQLPESNDPPNPEVKRILECLEQQDKREDLRKECRDWNNPFHEWFVKLDTLLDELRKALPNQ
jgi:hypothetical protein